MEAVSTVPVEASTVVAAVSIAAVVDSTAVAAAMVAVTGNFDTIAKSERPAAKAVGRLVFYHLKSWHNQRVMPDCGPTVPPEAACCEPSGS